MTFPGWRMHGKVAALWKDRAGNLTTMTALMAPVGLILAAVAVDSGSLYTQRRELQSFADIAAITASANLSNAEAAVRTTLTDNGIASLRIERDGQTLTPVEGETIAHIIMGRYTASDSIDVAARFVAGPTQPNAVRVHLKTLGTRYFGKTLISAPLIGTTGTARISATASFWIGSRLLALQGGLANAILGSLLGGNVSLSVMDYNALVQANVGVFDFLDKLALKANITAATYSDVLSTTVTLPQLISAMGDVPGLDATTKTAIRKLASAADPGKTVDLAKFLGLGETAYLKLGDRPSGLSAAANVYQMLAAAAAIANGDNQVALNLGAAVPGVLAATLDLAIGEPPQHSAWFGIGEVGTVVRTAQTRMLLTVQVGGPGGLLGLSIKVPIYIELATGEASISDIACVNRDPNSATVTLAVKPGVADLRIADITASSLDEFSRSPVRGPATMVQMPLVTVTGAAHVTIGNVNPALVRFTRSEIDRGVVKTVSTRDPATTLTRSLLDDLVLTVRLIGIDLGLSGILKGTLTTTLSAVAPAIDSLLMGVLDTLGIGIGQADVQVTGTTCARPALVQ